MLSQKIQILWIVEISSFGKVFINLNSSNFSVQLS